MSVQAYRPEPIEYGHGCDDGTVWCEYTDSLEQPSAWVPDLCEECDRLWFTTHPTEAERQRCRDANGGRRKVTCTGRCSRRTS